MSARGALRRLWRRLEVAWRLKRSLMEGVVVLLVVQAVVAVYVLFLLEQQPPEGATTMEVSSRVDQYVVLFTTTVAAQGLPQDLRQKPAYSKLGRRATVDNTRPRDDGLMARKYESEGPESVRPWLKHLSSHDKRPPYQNISWALPSEVGVPRNDLETEYPEKENGKSHKENQEKWLEEEDDPVLSRGYQEEFVTYRSDDKAVLLLEDEDKNFDQIATGTVDQFVVKRSSGRDKETNNMKHMGNNSNENKESWGTSGVSAFTGSSDKGNDRMRGTLSVSGTSNYKFKLYDISQPDVFILTNDTRTYFEDMGRGRTCFVNGTDRERTEQSTSNQCHCLKNYFGLDCGIPEAAWFGLYMNKFPDTNLRRREVPRRLINGLTVNHEFAMFEARMHELYDVVDVFIVAESNYTAHGDPKDLNFLTRFRQGYLRIFQEKIVYVNMSFFPSLSRNNGWAADAYLRYYLGEKGLPLLKGLRDDDLFVLSDSDELPTREILTFLKIYDGYPEPVSFALRWSIFGFFWLEPAEDSILNWLKGTVEQLTIVTSAATVGMLKKVFRNNVFYIRKKNLWQYYKLAKELRKYRDEGHAVKDWVAGTVGHYAGWHCSWCFSPVNLVRKMDSAQASDQPRWGDFPEKKDLTYIASRIWQGIWFDDKKHFLPVKDVEDRYYAPRHLLDRPDLYRSILYHPGHPLNVNKPWAPP